MRSTHLRHVFRQILSVSLLSPLVAVGAAACSGATTDDGIGDSDADANGSDGSTLDASSGRCDSPNAPRWTEPGCGLPPSRCQSPGTPEPACYTVVCGCSGKVIAGCGSFTEAYVALPGSFGPNQPFPPVGSACDPTPGDAGGDADAARDSGETDGCVTVPQPAADAGLQCESWTVPLPCSFPEDASAITPQACKSFCGPNAQSCSKNTAGSGLLRCDAGCAVGRRPEGFVPASSSRAGDATSITGLYFAAMAELEAASVGSFERLARELEAHGAPIELQRRARSAARDERRHARVAGALAHRFGGEARPVEQASMHVRPLEAIAIENAVEGCVRETFGALTATLQAERAGDARVKAAMRRIAVDETAHAGLAWAVAEWLETKLDAGTSARVRSARSRAVDELRGEMTTPQAAPLQRLAGLPSAEEAARMLDGMSDALWAA
jgi:hypothetical protein